MKIHFRVLKSSSRYVGPYDEGIVTIVRVKPSKNVDSLSLARRLALEYDNRCSCRHDCCGHLISDTDIHSLRNVKRNEWTIEVRSHRNI